MNSPPGDQEQSISEQIKRLESLLEKSSGDPRVALQLGQLYVYNEQPEEARSLLQELLDQARTEDNEELVAACMDGLGNISLFEDKIAEAIDWLTLALHIREKPDTTAPGPELLAQTCYNLALAYWANEEIYRAIELLERAASLLPHWLLAHDSLVRAYGAVGALEKQQEAMLRMASTQAEVVRQLSLDDNEPSVDESHYHYAQGMALEMAQDYAGAVVEFERSIKAGLVNSEVYRRLGICLSELDRYIEAVPALKRAIELDPKNPIPHADLAFLYSKLNMYQASASKYERAIELAPRVIDFYLPLVDVYLESNQADAAADWAKRAITIDEGDPRVHWLQGRVYWAQNRLLDCQNAWEKALELAPEGRMRDAVEKALNDLQESVAPSTVKQRLAAIEAWAETPNIQEGEPPEAVIAHLQMVNEIDPFFIEPQIQLAEIHLDMGNADDARQICARIVEEQPDNQEAGLWLGIALVEMGQLSDAEGILRKTNGLDPLTETGKAARMHLTTLDVRKRFGDLPAERFKESMRHYDDGKGDLEAAIEIMIEAVSLAPNVGLFHYELGWLYLLAERVDSATRQFRLAIEAQPEEGRFHSGLGMALVKQKKIQEAMPILQQAIGLDPADPDSHNALGMCYIALDEPLSAEAEFRKITELYPYREDGWLNLHELLLKQNKFGQASTELQRLLELVPDADFAKWAEQTLSGMLETTDEVVMHYGESEILPAEVATRLSKAAVRFCHEGRILETAGYIDSAVEQYQAAIAEDFEAFDPHFLLGNTYARVQQHREAIKEYSFAVSMEASDSEIADAYYNMGNSYRALEDLDRAISTYRNAIKVYPDILDVRDALGGCLAEQGKNEDAIKMIREEIDLRPEDNPSAVAHINLGALLHESGKELEKVFEILKGMAIGPRAGRFHILIGGILASKGLWNLAQSEFEKALEMEPDNKWAEKAVEAMRFVEYEVPWLLTADDPRVQHSLTWRSERIRQSYPPISERIEIVHLGDEEYETRRFPVGRPARDPGSH
jgi:tetratricopeptide (TPR) repeat protein